MFAIVQWSVPDIFFPLGVIADIMPICRASYEVMTPSGDTDLNEPWNTVLHKSNERVRTLMHNAAVPFVYIQFRFLLTTLLRCLNTTWKLGSESSLERSGSTKDTTAIGALETAMIEF